MVRQGMRVGVLLGGMSPERPVSLESGAAVARALRRRGWDVVEVDVGPDLPARLLAERVDVAWLALHGRFGEDGCVQGLLEVMGIPYTGSGVLASAMAMDKVATKRAVAHLDEVVVARDWPVVRGQALPDDVELPVICKPASGGSTLATAWVRTAEALAPAVASALAVDAVALIEELIEGDEITVAVVDGRALPVVRIAPESGQFDFEAKYTKGLTRYEVPAPIAPAAAERAQRVARRIYAALGCAGLCRVDFIVRADDVPVLLEINTLPGMTETSLSPMAAGAVGVSFDDLVEQILGGAHLLPRGA
jgi:D-alanine-D-alanine ligase